MSKVDPDRVERSIELRAPRSRVWRAVSSPKEFGAWFGLGESLELVGDFVPGARIAGKWRVDGRDVVEHFCTIDAIEPERMLSFHWVPYEVPAGEDHAEHPQTRIELRLEDMPGGTRLTVVESGFARLPPDKQYKRDQNADGWTIQLQSIAQHIHGRVEVKVQARIARAPADVFDAIVDPAKMSQYFISRGSARMTPNARIEWEWADAGAKAAIEVIQVVPDQKIIFLWPAAGAKTKVTLLLEADGDGTRITASEAPFALTEEGVARALGQNQGWTDFCCCLKAYLQHGINLRLGKRADHVA
jgi:uncharacterized protein YndB with AHSA1/START domain